MLMALTRPPEHWIPRAPSHRWICAVLNRALFLISLWSYCIVSARAEAPTSTSTFRVSATVMKACAFVTPNHFASVRAPAPGGSPALSSPPFNATCSVGASYSVEVAAGLASASKLSIHGTTRSSSNLRGYPSREGPFSAKALDDAETVTLTLLF